MRGDAGDDRPGSRPSVPFLGLGSQHVRRRPPGRRVVRRRPAGLVGAELVVAHPLVPKEVSARCRRVLSVSARSLPRPEHLSESRAADAVRPPGDAEHDQHVADREDVGQRDTGGDREDVPEEAQVRVLQHPGVHELAGLEVDAGGLQRGPGRRQRAAVRRDGDAVARRAQRHDPEPRDPPVEHDVPAGGDVGREVHGGKQRRGWPRGPPRWRPPARPAPPPGSRCRGTAGRRAGAASRRRAGGTARRAGRAPG